MISAILVKSRGTGFNVQTLMWDINNQNVASAVNPASEMKKFFDVFLSPSTQMLKWVSYLVTIVAGVGILVSIYNSVSARIREIAILRALGATRAKVLTLICLEAGLIGLFGGILGLVAGHALGALGSKYLNRLVGEGFDWMAVSRGEWLYLGAVVVLAVLAGLVPALKAYRTPVATNLVAG
jgi:putative ABC transport system permease protein